MRLAGRQALVGRDHAVVAAPSSAENTWFPRSSPLSPKSDTRIEHANAALVSAIGYDFWPTAARACALATFPMADPHPPDSSSPSILIAGGGIGGLAAALALARQGVRVRVLEQTPEIGEIGAGVQLAPNAFAAFDALGVGERARGRAVYTERMVMMDAVDGRDGRQGPARRDVPRALRQSVRGDPSRRRPPVAARGVRDDARIEVTTSTHVERFEQDERSVTVVDAQGRRHRGDALVGCDGVKSAVRQQLVGDDVRVSGHVVYRAVVDAPSFPRTSVERAGGVGRARLPPRPLSAARRRPVQRRRHLPQPRRRNLGRERRQRGGGAVVLRRHAAARAPAARAAEELEALGHRRPRADRALDVRPRDAARRRRASDAAVPGAGRVHGARGRGHARAGVSRERRRHRRRVRALRALARAAHGARRPDDARDGPPLSRQGRRAAGAQRPLDAAARPSATTTRSSGCTAGTSTAVWRLARSSARSS